VKALLTLRLKKIPESVRLLVRGAIENYAVQNRFKEITISVMNDARKNLEWKN